MSILIAALIGLLVLLLLLYAVRNYLPVDLQLKNLISIILIVLYVIWVLTQAGFV